MGRGSLGGLVDSAIGLILAFIALVTTVVRADLLSRAA